MRLVRLRDFGVTHAAVKCATQERRESTPSFRTDEHNLLWPGRTWCGKEYPATAYVIGDDGEPTCKVCLRCLAGPLGPQG